MSTVNYTRNEINEILNSDMTVREMLSALLAMPKDVVDADRKYFLAAMDRVETDIANLGA